MAILTIQYSYLVQVKPYTDEVEAVHIVPFKQGMHWCEDGICWCEPDLQYGDNVNLPDTMVMWVHKNYKPKWGS